MNFLGANLKFLLEIISKLNNHHIPFFDIFFKNLFFAEETIFL